MIPNSNGALESNSPNADRGSDGKSQDKSWNDLAEQASHEQDPQKLIELVTELCEALDRVPKPPVNATDAAESAEKPHPIEPTGTE